ncbi:hypothetical protein BOTBODRAFT_175576 [Botryobasidium botryosum FD-172 SS1]|uniref:Uncharacterized protein n=1 Tax=Botryobasidium botryosum (strain FD-172 SS1) TaxID=930990 RepID=A0A067MNW9_BOTB1|nr:hypothetical protein BOTBODRAFT_175576 [Botryobasidium botryosum FD-172 SS1]
MYYTNAFPHWGAIEFDTNALSHWESIEAEKCEIQTFGIAALEATSVTQTSFVTPRGIYSTDISHPVHQAAWTAATEGHESTTVHGATVQSPTIASQLPLRLVQPRSQPDDVSVEPQPLPLPDTSSASPPPDGFILTGKIALFGLDSLTADFYSHHGPVSSTEPIPEGTLPIYQMAVLEKDLRVSSILPQFVGKKFDVIDLKDVMFTYQNILLDQTKDVGFNINAEVVIDESYGQIHDVLSKFLKVPDPSLLVHCGLGVGQDWHHPLSVSSLSLQGVFPNTQAEPISGVKFTSIGVRLIGSEATADTPEGSKTSGKDFSYSVFGSMHLTVPGSSIPLDLDYDITEAGGAVSLSAQLSKDWEHAFGVPDLTLQEVAFSADFDLVEPLSTLKFDISATMKAGDTPISLHGSYSTQGDYSLSASISNLDFSGINGLYQHLFGETLLPPDVDVHIGAATLTIAKGDGFTLDIHDLRIGEHTACDGTVNFSSHGAMLRASIEGDALTIGKGLSDPIHISDAYVQVAFGREEKGMTTDVLLGGTFEWESFKFDVGIHVYPAPDGEAGLEYTVYGKFETAEGAGLPLVTLVPQLKNTLVENVTLHDAAIIVASRDDGELGALSHSGYPIKKGIQVCAILSELAPFDAMAKDSHPASLILCAGWSSSEGFFLDIHFPTPTTLNIGRGITTDEIELRIVLGKEPYLEVITGAKIPVEKRPEPLHFDLSLTLGVTEATATGQLSAKGGWNNPFGLSDQLTVGPDLALSISLCYATGPSGLGFVGGLGIGKTSGNLAFQVDEIPSHELLYARIENLDIHDLVEMANEITHHELIKPPNVVQFELVELYICPAGVTIGNLVYKPGFSFSSKITFFGIKSETLVNIGDGGIHCYGALENFKIGNFIEIKGAVGDKATFDLELNSTKQGGSINGMIYIFGITAKVLATLELHPTLTFEFEFDLSFDEIFDFTVKGGPVIAHNETSCDATKSDYKLTAEFHLKIRDHIGQKLNAMFAEQARKDREEADAARAAVDQEHAKWQAKVDEEQKKLDDAYAAWQKKSDEAHAKHQAAIAAHETELNRLQGNLDNEASKLKLGTAAAEAKLSAAMARQEANTREKENNLRSERQRVDDKLRKAHADLDEATQKMHNGFGNAEHNIDVAQQKVDSLKASIEDISGHIQSCENAHWYDVPAKAAIPGLYIEKAAVVAAKAIADGVLTAAKAVLQAGDFLACKGAMAAASTALDVAQVACDEAIKVATAALEATITLEKGLVQVETAALEEVKTLGEGAIKVASAALEDYKKASVAILKVTQDAIDGLTNCAEWLAYEAAKTALEAAKAAGSGALLLAHAAIDVGEAAQQAALKLKDWAASFFFSLVTITDITLSLELGGGVGGFVFNADIKGEMGGHFFHLQGIEFDTEKAKHFIVAVFDKLVAEVEKGFLEGKLVQGLADVVAEEVKKV